MKSQPSSRITGRAFPAEMGARAIGLRLGAIGAARYAAANLKNNMEPTVKTMQKLVGELRPLPNSSDNVMPLMVVNNATEKSSTASISAESNSIVNELFAVFIARYSNRFVDSIPSDGVQRTRVRAEWASAIGHFHPEKIRIALEACRVAHPSWPPTCDEFAKLCREAHVPVQHLSLPGPREAPPPGIFDELRAACGVKKRPNVQPQ